MRFDTKIAIAVREDLATWQKLNVTAFLASGLAAGVDELTGKPYEDGSGHLYLEMFRQPVLIFTGTASALAAVRERALARSLPTGIYHRRALRDRQRRRQPARRSGRCRPILLRLAGVAVYGPRNAVDKVCKGLTLPSRASQKLTADRRLVASDHGPPDVRAQS